MGEILAVTCYPRFKSLSTNKLFESLLSKIRREGPRLSENTKTIFVSQYITSLKSSNSESAKMLLFHIVLLLCITAGAMASPVSAVIRNFARGSALKCTADLCGGLPFEVWKSSVALENIRASNADEKPASDLAVLSRIIHERGVQVLWSGCSARMVEGFFSGAVLLAAKEAFRKTLTATPVVTKICPPSAIGLIAGAGGGAAQAIVMAPCSLLVTAAAANGGSVLNAAKDVWSRKGLSGIYRGAPAVSARQATNWASRQGFTEFIRPRISIPGPGGEIVAGLIGATVSCWNTPFEVARIESQSKILTTHHRKNNADSEKHTLFETMEEIVKKRGLGGLYTGVVPRIFQSCYQTIFLVTIPRLLDS